MRSINVKNDFVILFNKENNTHYVYIKKYREAFIFKKASLFKDKMQIQTIDKDSNKLFVIINIKKDTFNQLKNKKNIIVCSCNNEGQVIETKLIPLEKH